MNPSAYYKLSGKLSPLGLIMTLMIGLVGVIVSAGIYGYAMAWLPIVYFNILLVIGYGFGMSALSAMAVRYGKIRNTAVGLLCGLIIGIAALYSCWVVWLFAQSSQEIFIWDPVVLWSAILHLGDQGLWSIKGFTPKGAVLFAFWSVEAIAILGGAISGALNAVTQNAFCESCKCWMDDELILGTFKPTSEVSKIRQDLESSKIEELKTLYAVPDSVPHHTATVLEKCPNCDYQLLSLKDRIVTFDDNGNPNVKDSELVSRLSVNDKLVEELQQYWFQSLEAEEKKLKEILRN